MGRQLGELNSSVRDNLPIASMGSSQNMFSQLSMYIKEYLCEKKRSLKTCFHLKYLGNNSPLFNFEECWRNHH